VTQQSFGQPIEGFMIYELHRSHSVFGTFFTQWLCRTSNGDLRDEPRSGNAVRSDEVCG
jgi:hypothetical protein